MDRWSERLSKWVRNSLNHQPDFQFAIRGIEQFSKNMIQNPPHKRYVKKLVLLPFEAKKSSVFKLLFGAFERKSSQSFSNDNPIASIDPISNLFASDPRLNFLVFLVNELLSI